MAIVRSLLIGIGFRIDRRAIATANQAITGFKTRFAIAASAATYAFSKLTGFFSGVATAALDAQDLANSLGTSLREVTGIQESFKNFRIGENESKQLLQRVNELFQGFKLGFNTQLADIARGLKFEIDRGGNSLKVLDQILNGLRQVENEQQRIEIASELFGNALGARIAKAAENYDQFKESAQSFTETLGKQREEGLPVLKAYEQSIVELGRKWDEFVMGLAPTLVPVLTSLMQQLAKPLEIFFKALDVGLTAWNAVFSFDWEKIKAAAKKGSEFLDPLFNATGLNHVSDFFKNASYQKFVAYAENREGALAANGMLGNAAVEVTNNITVPPGTTEEQAQYMSNEIRLELEQAIYESFIEIQNNNPTVE